MAQQELFDVLLEVTDITQGDEENVGDVLKRIVKHITSLSDDAWEELGEHDRGAEIQDWFNAAVVKQNSKKPLPHPNTMLPVTDEVEGENKTDDSSAKKPKKEKAEKPPKPKKEKAPTTGTKLREFLLDNPDVVFEDALTKTGLSFSKATFSVVKYELNVVLSILRSKGMLK